MSRKIKIRERKLGREKALGQCWPGKHLVEIDPRQDSLEYMDTAIHETLHDLFPDMTEPCVGWAAGSISKALWKLNYRRIKP